MTNCPSRLAIAQFITDDLGTEVRQELAHHLDDCHNCKLEAQTIRQNADGYKKREGVQSNLNKRINAEAHTSRRRKSVVGMGIAAVAAAASVIMILAFLPRHQSEKPNILYKGAMTFEVIAKRGTQQFRVEANAELMEGDALRFVVFTEDEGFLYVFSLDAKGNISPFYPDLDAKNDPSPMHLDAPGFHELPDSIVLDDTVGDEQFIVVFSRSEFSRIEIEELILDEVQTGSSNVKVDVKPELKVRQLHVVKTTGGVL